MIIKVHKRFIFFFNQHKLFIFIIKSFNISKLKFYSLDLDLRKFKWALHTTIFAGLERLQKVQEGQKASQLHPLHDHGTVHPKRVYSKVEIQSQQDLVETERALHQPEETQLHVERVPQGSQKLLQIDVQTEVPQVWQEVGRQQLNDCWDDPQRDRNFSQRIRQLRWCIPVLLQSALQPEKGRWEVFREAKPIELKLQNLRRILWWKQRDVFGRLPWIQIGILLYHKLRTNLLIKTGRPI